MKKIFYDEKIPVQIAENGSQLELGLFNIYSIFPALHYFEQHTEKRDSQLSVAQITSIDEGVEKEIYHPHLIGDFASNTMAYQNYNFILLNDKQQHDTSYVVNEFIRFLNVLPERCSRPRKLKIKEFNPEYFNSLNRTLEGKQNFGKGEIFYTFSDKRYERAPAIVCMWLDRISPGTRKRIGFEVKSAKHYQARLRNSKLEERLVIK